MRYYRQLSYTEREEIALLNASGLSARGIAQQLGRSTSTISRELGRNGNASGSYTAGSANARSLSRRQRTSLLNQDEALSTFVLQRLHSGWSPQMIAGWLAQGYEALRYINHESIYRWIYARTNRQAKLWQLLFQRKRTRKPNAARRSKAGLPSVYPFMIALETLMIAVV